MNYLVALHPTSKMASPARREAPRLRAVASREEAPPAPAPAAGECAADRRSSAPADELPFQCGSPASGITSSAPAVR